MGSDRRDSGALAPESSAPATPASAAASRRSRGCCGWREPARRGAPIERPSRWQTPATAKPLAALAEPITPTRNCTPVNGSRLEADARACRSTRSQTGRRAIRRNPGRRRLSSRRTEDSPGRIAHLDQAFDGVAVRGNVPNSVAKPWPAAPDFRYEASATQVWRPCPTPLSIVCRNH